MGYLLDTNILCDLIRNPFGPVAQRIEAVGAKAVYTSIIVAAEGARPKEHNRFVVKTDRVDEFGHKQLGGIGSLIAQEIERLTGFETRVTVLGPIQRGGSPTAFDRVLATRFGVKAAEMVECGTFGSMVSLQGNKIVEVKLAELIDKVKPVDSELYDIAEVFFG